jgi:hypothetical protein
VSPAKYELGIYIPEDCSLPYNILQYLRQGRSVVQSVSETKFRSKVSFFRVTNQPSMKAACSTWLTTTCLFP